MIEVADVFRRFAEAYRSRYGEAMLPSHHRAIRDILNCRTAAQGGHVYQCDRCGHEHHAWHSCKNRSCPKCHTEQTRQWLDKRQAQMLPVPYFHVVTTVPKELRAIFRSNQKDCYGLLMRATGEAIVELARDPRYCGGTVGVLAVLHTWTQRLDHHPHVHCLVTGGGISKDGSRWLYTRKKYLVPEKPLARMIRGKFLALLKKARPDLRVPPTVWDRDWVVHCVPWGAGETAVLEYLARYAHRIALSNCRLMALDDACVVFRYKDRKAGIWRTCRLSGEEFMRRFLQHVLPKGFHKIRYFGLWHPSRRMQLQSARTALLLDDEALTERPAPNESTDPEPPRLRDGTMLCPHCKQGHLKYLKEVPRPRSRGP